MKIISLVIATLVIGMFISGYFTFTAFVLNANGMTSDNITGNATNGNISATQETIESMYKTSETMQSTNSTPQGNIVTFAPLNLIYGAYTMVLQALKAPLFFLSLIGDLTHDITGLPTWVGSDLMAIISAIVVWEIIFLIIGRK